LTRVGFEKHGGKILLLWLLMLFAGLVFASGEDVEELSYLYGGDDFVSIATGHRKRVAEAPAVASVITAKEIEAMGAQSLSDVLEAVPGLHISLTETNYNPVVVMRGVRSDLNQQVLFLINGLPIKNAALGDRGEVLRAQSIKSIARVEVIRGPGSAMFGADALSGVINIITKSAADIPGLEVGGSAGSFDSKHAWLLYGGKAADWDIAFGFDAEKTAGFRPKINADQQTLLDASMLTSASLAPGRGNLGRESVSVFVDAEKSEWRIRASYQGVFNQQTGAGLAGALDPDGEGGARRFTFDATYHQERLTENWSATTTFSFYDLAFLGGPYTLYPAGAFGAFPNGVIGNPRLFERHYGIDFTTFYTGFDGHTVRLGAGYRYNDLYRVEDARNFDLSGGVVPVDLGAVRRVSEADAFNTESLRRLSYLFVQDEWRLTSDWVLFAGARYDHFSDFGGTFNPRLAVVWVNSHLTSKFLYGRAFRAPSFGELSNKNNPVNIGNPDLEPEVTDTYEIAFDYAYSPDLRVGLSFYYYQVEDLIRFTPVASNEGGQTGRGAELEFDWAVSPATRLNGSFSLLRSEDKGTGEAVADVPEEQLYLKLTHQLTSRWAVSSRLNWVLGRERDFRDARKSIDDYATLDLTLKSKGLLSGVDVELSVFNMTDENAREPSRYNIVSGSVALPGDLPLPGRSFVLSVSKRW